MLVGGQYLMFYVGVRSGGKQPCIRSAKSSDGINFKEAGLTLCSPAPMTNGYYDPSIFIDTNGDIYLLFSEEWSGCGGGPDSKLWIQQLSSNGLSLVGSATELFDWSQAIQIVGLPSNLGSSPCLENPQMVTDVDNYHDLTFSIGTWEVNSQYVTGEVPCDELNNTSSGCGWAPQDGGVLITPGGGASTLTTGDPSSNYLIYAKWTTAGASSGGVRQDWTGPTHSCNPNGNTCN